MLKKNIYDNATKQGRFENMMAGLFLIFSLSIGSILYGKQKIAIVLFWIGIFSCLLMLWYHATSILQINL